MTKEKSRTRIQKRKKEKKKKHKHIHANIQHSTNGHIVINFGVISIKYIAAKDKKNQRKKKIANHYIDNTSR